MVQALGLLEECGANSRGCPPPPPPKKNQGRLTGQEFCLELSTCQKSALSCQPCVSLLGVCIHHIALFCGPER